MEVGKIISTYECTVNHDHSFPLWIISLLGWQFIEPGRLNLRVVISQSGPTMNSQLQVTDT